MKRHIQIAALALLLAALLCGCGQRAEPLLESTTAATEPTAVTQAAPETTPTESAEPQFRWNYTSAHFAFQQALKTIHDQLYLPKLATKIDLWEPGTIEEEKFAVYDVDGDGEQELLVFISNTYIAGMCEVIYGYDSQEDDLFVEMINFPSITHYPSMLKASASHNHGHAGDVMWPYTVMTYNQEKDVYEDAFFVDAWDKNLAEYDSQLEMAYPEDIDTDQDGFVYLITEKEEVKILNKRDFQQWEAALFDGKEPMTIPWRNITAENIGA